MKTKSQFTETQAQAMAKKQAAIGRLRRIVFAFCKGVDTPRALKLWMLVKHNEWTQVAKFKVHPTEYLHYDDFMVDYAISNFLRKTEGLPAVVDTREVAKQSFKTTELQCAATNVRLRSYTRGEVSPLSLRVHEVIHLAQRKIGNLLGGFSVEAAQEMCSWGNGATSDLSKSEAYLDDKVVVLPFSCTPAAWKHAAAVIQSDRHWKEAIIASNGQYKGPIIDGHTYNVFDTVPKTVLTDRCIAKEPRMNGFLQKGAGSFIRRKLRRVGIDLNDQSRNQLLAGMARTVGYCTVDLESASDTVATEAVRLLLPEPVFEYLNDIRSKECLIDGDLVQLEKFSSMGNAFTFELESLIFWAIAAACSEVEGWSTVGVFGDDIIVRKEVFPLLRSAIEFLGFSINIDKTFVTGDFFESCGKHYFKDHDVTPIYQKCVPRTDMEAIRLCNRILRFAHRLCPDGSLDKRIEGAWRCAVREYSVAEFGGPISERDDYLNVPRQSIKSPYSPNRGYRVKTVSEESQWIPANDYALYSLWLRLSGGGESPDNSRRNRSAVRHFENVVRGRLHEEGVIVNAIRDSIRIISLPGTSNRTLHGMIQSRVSTKFTTKVRWVQPSRQPALDW